MLVCYLKGVILHDYFYYVFLHNHRSEEIDEVTEQQLKENRGFVDNFARGTAHMFK